MTDAAHPTMVRFLEGLSIRATTVIVAVLAGLLTAAVWSISQRPHVRWWTAVIGPFIVAIAFYSLPVLFAEESSEYAHWAGLFIATWGAAGLVTSLVIGFVWTLANRRSSP
jgi:hypothetical protein